MADAQHKTYDDPPIDSAEYLDADPPVYLEDLSPLERRRAERLFAEMPRP